MADLTTTPFGLLQGFENASLALRMTAAVFLGVSLFNSLELIVLVCWTFRQWRGLYFWSLLVSSVGIIPYVIGSILHNWNLVPLGASLPVVYLGFICIVPVQSLILYSRLYLVFYHEKILRVMLNAIIAVSIVLVIPNTVCMFGSAFIRGPSWNYAYNVTERLQVTGFAVQEVLISLFYVYSAVALLRVSAEGKSRVKRMMYELLGINAFTIALDVAVLIIEYMHLFSLQVYLKVFVYSVKVKLEFAVLGRLVEITTTTKREEQKKRVRRSSFIGPSFNLSTLTDTNGATIGTDTDRGPLSVSTVEVEQSATGNSAERIEGNTNRREVNGLARRMSWTSNA
ncbi:hypothetical protein BDW75DRAFT_245607 [Aspergillus navahoensis]